MDIESQEHESLVIVVSTNDERRELAKTMIEASRYSVHVASSAEGLMSIINRYSKIDCVVSDDWLENGVRATDVLLRFLDEGHDIPFVLLSTSNSNTDVVLDAAQLGVVDVIPDDFARPQLLEAVDKASRLQSQCSQRRAVRDNLKKLNTLSIRERRILELATIGLPNKSIASRLSVSVKTIERCRKAAYEKLEVRTTAEMACAVTMAKLHDVFLPNFGFAKKLVPSESHAGHY